MSSAIAEAFAELLHADPGAMVAHTAAGPRTRQDLHLLAQVVDQQLAARGEAEAEAARGTGTGTPARIGLCLRDGFTLLAAFLAVARRADTAVLFDAADPRAPRFDLAQRLDVRAIVVDVPELSVHAVVPAGRHAAAQTDCLRGRHVRAIKLTSGSTGEPNAVAVGDRELLADAKALERTMGIGAGDRVFAAVPMSFSYGIGNLLVPALAHGRELVLPRDTPVGLLQAMRVGEPTVLPAVPALLRALQRGSFSMPPSMRLVLSAGAVLRPDVATAFRERFGLPVHTFYGSTESGGVTYDRTGTAAERGTVGTAVDGVDVRVDGDGRVCVRSPAVGEALPAGDSLPGSLGDERGQTVNPGNGCFLAPDLGELVDGELRLLGRAGSVFDVGGHKVDPREIEAIIRGLVEVRDVEVVPWRDEHGRAVSVAIVAGRGLVEDDVRRHCARTLPAAKVPRRLVVVDEVPRTSRGKLSRDSVQALLAAADADRRAIDSRSSS